METQTLIDDILNGTEGPLVEYDPHFGVHQYSALVDILVELDPERTEALLDDVRFARLDEEQRLNHTNWVWDAIDDAVVALNPDLYFYVSVDYDDEGLWFGLWGTL